MLLLRREANGKGGPAVCTNDRFGNQEAWGRFRTGEGDWKEKQILATDTLTLFEVKSEKAPLVGGNLIPGVVEGRVVVFDDEAKPKCELSVRAEGPDSAWATKSKPNEDANRKLCGILTAEVRRRLAAPSQAAPAPSGGAPTQAATSASARFEPAD